MLCSLWLQSPLTQHLWPVSDQLASTQLNQLQGEHFLLAPQQTSLTRIATDCWRYLKAVLNHAIINEFIGHLVWIPVSWLQPTPEELHTVFPSSSSSLCIFYSLFCRSLGMVKKCSSEELEKGNFRKNSKHLWLSHSVGHQYVLVCYTA